MTLRIGNLPLPPLPSFLALVAAAIVVTGTWIVPATKDSEATVETIGRAFNFEWDGSRDRAQTYDWTYTLDISGEPGDWAVLPRLPFSFLVEGGSASSASHFVLDIRIYINDQQAHRQETGGVLYKGDAGGFDVNTPFGTPSAIDEIDQTLLQSGQNKLRYVVNARLDVEEPGTQIYTVELGPVRAYTYAADSQGDGVLDIHQVVPFHAALVAVPGAVVAAAGVFLVSAKAVAWWRVRGSR